MHLTWISYFGYPEVLAVKLVSIFVVWKGKERGQYPKGKVGGICYSVATIKVCPSLERVM